MLVEILCGNHAILLHVLDETQVIAAANAQLKANRAAAAAAAAATGAGDLAEEGVPPITCNSSGSATAANPGQPPPPQLEVISHLARLFLIRYHPDRENQQIIVFENHMKSFIHSPANPSKSDFRVPTQNLRVETSRKICVMFPTFAHDVAY